MTIKDRVRRVKHKIERSMNKRHEAKAGSDRRAHLGRLVRFFRDRLSHLVAVLAKREVDWRGLEPVLGRKGRQLVRKAAEFGLIPTSTTGGVHAPTSYHYQRRAIDFGVIGSLVGTAEARTRLVNFQKWLVANKNQFVEVFGPDNNLNVKYGQQISLAEGTDLEQAHDNHDHVAV